MSRDGDIDEFAQDPNLLARLCREVVDRLDARARNAEVQEKEAQLREISRAIDRLEKAGVAVPDVLRAEKTQLAAALGVLSETSEALSILADQFEEITKDVRARLGQDARATTKRRRVARSNLETVGRKVLREHIVQVLAALGGRGRVEEVLDEVGRQLEPELLPGDKVWRESANMPAWRNNAQWERARMVKDGLLRSDSARGYWELSEDRR